MPTDPELLEGRYELRLRLGRGAMGEVWQAYDRRLGRAVAIKRIHPQRCGSPTETLGPAELVARFRREAEVLGRLRHPGIPVLYDARLDGAPGELYLVMELILGRTLEEIIGERQLSEAEIVVIAMQVCDILEHAHTFPFIHRDLKPANILMTGYQRVVLLDFGVAAAFRSNQQRLTSTERLLGTLAYMPPEQFDGRSVTPCSDLYALACILYQLLTGTPPFRGDALMVMDGHKYRLPAPMSLRRHGITPALNDLVMATLSKRRPDRPSSAREFRDHLLPLVDGTGFTESLAPTVAHTPALAGMDHWNADPLPLAGRIEQAQRFFEEGLFGAAALKFEKVVEELAATGPESLDTALRCRARLAHCRLRQGDHHRALKDFRALLDAYSRDRSPEDRLLLDARLQIGKLRLEHGDEGGSADFIDVFRILTTTRQPGDEPMLAEVEEALTRANLWVSGECG